jgi:hypothetical protein
MTKFLMNCEFEAHVSLAQGVTVLRYAHPAGKYNLFLRDLQVEPGNDPLLLSMQLVFSAESYSHLCNAIRAL